MVLALTACSPGEPGPKDTQQSEPTPGYGDAVSRTQSTGLHANGTVYPIRSLPLSFATGGAVATLDVEVGMQVHAGQMIASLDAVDLQRAVTQAELRVEHAALSLAQLESEAVPVPARLIAATAAISSAKAALAQAQARYELRDNQTILDQAALTEAEQGLRDAQNAYDNLLKDGITRDWAPYSPAARALEDMQDHYRLTLAQFRLHSADRGYEVAIAQAETQVAQAELALYEVQHPVAPETLALAKLEVKQAGQALAVAKEDLARVTLSAPFDGIVAAVHTGVGAWTMSGAPVVDLLDVSRWRVETKNVGELEIARVHTGQAVDVRVNAFPDQTLVGHVATISPVAIVQQGDTTYTVMIELAETDLDLRPGMTVQVAFIQD